MVNSWPNMRTETWAPLNVSERSSELPLHWRHHDNDHGGVSNHQPHGCLLNRLFRRRSKKTSKLRVTGHCAGNHRDRWIPCTKGQLRGKCFYLMTSSWLQQVSRGRDKFAMCLLKSIFLGINGREVLVLKLIWAVYKNIHRWVYF